MRSQARRESFDTRSNDLRGYSRYSRGVAGVANVDVVIPAHNAASTVEEAVRSALAQASTPSRVTVVADACSDGTAARAAALGVEVLEIDARSVAVARNRGAAAGSSEWIAFLDADDLWRNTWLAAARAVADGDQRASVLYGSVEELDERGMRVRRSEEHLPEGDVFETLLAEGFLTTSAVIVRRDVFERSGGFDEGFARAGVEDWDLWLRLAASEQFAAVRGWHVVYRRLPSSAMRSVERFSSLRADAISVVQRALRLRRVDPAVRRAADARVFRESAQRHLNHGYRREGLADVRRALAHTPDDTRLFGLLAIAAVPTALARPVLKARRRVLAARSPARSHAMVARKPARGRAPVRVVHVITGLGQGGAESMLVQLVTRMDKERFQNSVVCLLPEGPNAQRLRDAGVAVFSLEMNARTPDPTAIVRLARWLRRSAPDVVQTWLYHGDLIGGLAARLAEVPAVVWGLHTSAPPTEAKLGTRATVALCRATAERVPTAIVSCSQSGMREHVRLGYPAERMVVIPNGFDAERFRPRPASRKALRAQLGVDDATALIGLPARVVPEKDHPCFLSAMERLRGSGRAVRFVLCGDGATSTNQELSAWIAERGLEDAAILLGRRDDMEQVLPALDVVCSASRVEAFSMALGEALAAGVPCVATDVGDSRVLVDGGGVVVPAGDPRALAEGIATLLDEGQERRRRRGDVGRAHILAGYGLDACTRHYEALYERLARQQPGSPRKRQPTLVL